METRDLMRRGVFIALAVTLVMGMSLAFNAVKAATGNDYYVAIDGDDNNPGSLELPWRTIQKAADTMVAGDTIFVLAGEYGERVQITNSGETDSPITYRAEDTVKMKGFTVRADYIVIQGFEITDTDWGWTDGWGIYVDGSHNIIESNYVYYCVMGGIVLSSNSNQSVARDNRLYRNGMVGIEVNGRDNDIIGNEVWRTIQHHPKWPEPHPDWLDADGMRFFGSGHIFRKNYIHDITFDDPENVNPHIDCFQSWMDEYHEAASDIIFEQNICKVLETQAERENGHGFMLANVSNVIIRNNIIQAYGGVNTGGGGNSYLTIVNNIFVNDLSFQKFWPMGLGLEDAPNTIVKNNIFYDQPYHTISVTGNASGQEIDYNFAYRSDGIPSDCYRINYQCVNPVPAHHIWNIDPLFVDPGSDDFHLKEGSPAIDAGIALADVLDDFDGNPRPFGIGYDIGGYEFNSKTQTPTFIDVPIDHWAYDYIETLYQEGYIAGCNTSPLSYCPDDVMIRAESAVFVERGLHGGDYIPDQPNTSIFEDVLLTDWYAKWVTALWEDGYTAGCDTDPLNYCPMEEITRAEGAVFFLRMLNGYDYVPAEPTGMFVDSSLDMWYTKWLEEAYLAGIIPACETNPELRICPMDALKRDMGAYMMFQAKGLELP